MINYDFYNEHWSRKDSNTFTFKYNGLFAQFRPFLAHRLAQIFQQSLDSGEDPDDWRTANVTPIHKKR